jgi:PAS domain S-box-containing protein
VIGKPIPFAVSGEPMTEAAALIRKAIEDGAMATGAVRARRHDGSAFWMEVDVSSIRDAKGAVANSIVVFHDITDRRAAIEALRTSEERFRLVTNATSDVVWDWDVHDGRCWYSSGMATVFGHQIGESERIPTIWQEHLHPDDAMAVLQSMEDLISGANESWSGTYRFRRGDGTWATVNDRAFVVRDPSGRALRVVGSMTDATERLALEDQLRQAQKLEAVGQLTGGIAHDFNNLLTIIIGSAEILADTVKEPSRRWMVEAVMDAAERGAALVARLMAFARRQPLAPVPLDLGSALMQLESMLRRTIPNTIEIRMSLAPDLAIVSIDPNQFDNAILNLCVNARDAMPSGGTLIIETANTRLDEDYARRNPGVEPGEYVAVSVSDSGSGMPKDVLARAFEPFFSTKASGKGTGMGLSMVFGFVKQSRGHIKLYSEPGQGTTVRLYFPHDRAATLPEDGRAADIPMRWQGNEHILMVEDDPAVRKHVAELLTSFGYRVTAAGSGPEALAALDELSEVALLFTDVVLPGGLNGRELADQALAQRPDLRVLFTSGYTRNVMLNDGRLGPGFDLLSKPYRRTELAAKVREVLDRPAP